jgi:hypothetical protein
MRGAYSSDEVYISLNFKYPAHAAPHLAVPQSFGGAFGQDAYSTSRSLPVERRLASRDNREACGGALPSTARPARGCGTVALRDVPPLWKLPAAIGGNKRTGELLVPNRSHDSPSINVSEQCRRSRTPQSHSPWRRAERSCSSGTNQKVRSGHPLGIAKELRVTLDGSTFSGLVATRMAASGQTLPKPMPAAASALASASAKADGPLSATASILAVRVG